MEQYIEQLKRRFTKEELEMLLSALDQTALVSITDANGNILYVNEQFITISKYSLEELIGKNYQILKSGQQSDEVFTDLWKTISSGKAWRDEIKNRSKDGNYYWVDTSIVPTLGSSGKMERCIWIGFIISSRKKLEEDFQAKAIESENSQKAIINLVEDLEKERVKIDEARVKDEALIQSIGDGMIATDENGRIIHVNARLTEILGFSEKEVIGQKAIEFIKLLNLKDEKPISGEDSPMIEALTTGKPVSGTFYIINKDNRKFAAAITVSPIILRDKPSGVIEIIRDVTHEIEIDKAKSEFVSLASHQLRTPLSTIGWYSEMLLSGDAGKLSDAQKKYVDEIYKGNKRMVELVNALLNVSRLELGIFMIEPKLTDLTVIAESVKEELTPQMQSKKLMWNSVYSPLLTKINVDEKLMRMIFQNILSNAVKYTPSGGAITLTIDEDDSNVLIKVEDTGLGIPDNQKQNIFTKLFRADNARISETEGTGLGLYIVKSILDQSGGKVWFESKENKGTIFYVSIPLSGMQAKSGIKALA